MVVAKASKKQQLEFNKIMREVIYENEPNIPKGRIDTDTKVLKKDILKKRTPNTDVKLGASHLDINRLDPFAKRVTPTPPLPSSIPTRTPEVAQARRDANKLGEMLKTEKYWKSISKTPEELQTHYKNHAYNFQEKTRLMSNISNDEMNRVMKEYGLEDEKRVATKKVIKSVPKNVNAVPSAKSPYGGNIPSVGQTSYKLKIKKSAPAAKVAKVTHPLPSRPFAVGTTADPEVRNRTSREGIQSGISPMEKRLRSGKQLPPTAREVSDASLQSGISPMEKSLHKDIPSVPTKILAKPVSRMSKIASSSAGRIASRIANSGVVRAAGTAGMVIGAAGDIVNISKAAREVRKAIIYKPVESIPRKITTNEQVANLAKAKARSVKSSAIPNSQAQRNAEAGAKLRANPNWQKSKPSAVKVTARMKSIPVMKSGVDTKPTSITPTVTTNKSTKPSAEGTSAVSSSSSRTARKVSTPLRSIVSKRPDQITEDLSFLNPPSFTSSVRKSPVRPIPTRVQMPEQFMSPSMSLASLPRSKSLKELGVSKWR